jgi:hypothetical protein
MSVVRTEPRFTPAAGFSSSRTIVSSSPMPVSFDIGTAPARQNFAPMYCGGLCDAVVVSPPSEAMLPIPK